MMNMQTLEAMDDKTLLSWIVRRMRGEEANPLLSEIHRETPDDFIAIIHGKTTNTLFRARLENGIVEALREIGKNPDLRSGIDAGAAQHLAMLVMRLALGAAVPILLVIAERGILGRAQREIDADAERCVLLALARLQEPKLLAHHWIRIWGGSDPSLWPIATAGLRRADPEQGIALLPEIIAKAKKYRRFPLGEVLWAFRADPNIGPVRLAQEFEKFGKLERTRCRKALEDVGATAGDIEELFPAPSSKKEVETDVPTWASADKNLPTTPPRWSIAA